jgi:hypothetical protein
MMAKKQTNDETAIIELDRVRKLLSFLPVDEKFIRVMDKIWAVREHLFNKNAKYFLDKDYSHAIKRDAKQAMIETIIELVRDNFVKFSQAEQDAYWKKGMQLLQCVAMFKKIMGEE